MTFRRTPIPVVPSSSTEYLLISRTGTMFYTLPPRLTIRCPLPKRTLPLSIRSVDLQQTSLPRWSLLAKLLFISLCFGISLAVNAWVFYRIGGGLLNPAVTLAMVIVGAVSVLRGILVIISQILGAMVAAAVVEGLTPGRLNVGTGLGGVTTTSQGLFIEMFLTAQLVFTILMLGRALLAAGFYLFVKALQYETVNPGQDDAGDAPVHEHGARDIEAWYGTISRCYSSNG
ncbi:hypothetical protein DL764_008881 [Monosporascus ibericus]|uniref:Aquaporin n=1 Tax=Monosporascus ibericus TaxID=155417 RepID=A0A4Q4SYN4_9PEZI|nr:hypothetical protein DL764_008881 [Monosporascus ibericus]